MTGFNTDDLDALIFDDSDGGASYTPGDTIYFSVRRGSAVIGALDTLFGLQIEPGDVLTLPAVADGLPAIFIAAESLGLTTVRSHTAGPFGADELDALELRPEAVEVPSIGPRGLSGLAGLLLAIPLSIAWLRRLRKA